MERHGACRNASAEGPSFRLRIFKIEQSLELINSSSFCGSLYSHQRKYETKIFGRTPDGISACLRLTDVLPYFFVSYCGPMTDSEMAKGYIKDLGESLFLMTSSLHSDCILGAMPFQLVLVKGIPFYGYHKFPKLFLKVILHQPSLKTALINIFQGGFWRNTVFQVFEAHISAVQQFMVDYNLFGMDWIIVSKVTPVPSKLKRTTCQIEVCAHPRHILNRQKYLDKLPIRPKLGKRTYRTDISILDSLTVMERDLFDKFNWKPSAEEEQLLLPSIEADDDHLLSSLNMGSDPASFLINRVPYVADLRDYDLGLDSETADNICSSLDHDSILCTPLERSKSKILEQEILNSPTSKKLFELLNSLKDSVHLEEESGKLNIFNDRAEAADPNDPFLEDSSLLPDHTDGLDESASPDGCDNVLVENHTQHVLLNHPATPSNSGYCAPEPDPGDFGRIATWTPTTFPLGSESPVPLLSFDDGSSVEYSSSAYSSFQSTCAEGTLGNFSNEDPRGVELITKQHQSRRSNRTSTPGWWKAPPLDFTYTDALEFLAAEKKDDPTTLKHLSAQSQDKTGIVNVSSSGLAFLACEVVTAAEMTTKLIDPDRHAILGIALLFVDDTRDTLQEEYFWLRMDDEVEILNKVIEIVTRVDPDILVGHSLESTWGYMIRRSLSLNVSNFAGKLSRYMKQPVRSNPVVEFEMPVDVNLVSGRFLVNNWRVLRSEGSSNGLGYSLEAFAYHMAGIRLPHYGPFSLYAWLKSPSQVLRDRVSMYLRNRLTASFSICREIYSRTCEFSRCYGIEWNDVFNRGSQFRVESFLFRGAKLESFVLFSPSARQVQDMPSMIALPLVMEPLAGFYSDPVCVFDFQSLYPSVIIANNLCFSTCLGDFKGVNGVLRDFQSDTTIEAQHIYTTSCGGQFVDKGVREGLLPKLVREILSLRLPLKHFAKSAASGVHAVALDHRQLALKLIANVIFGYTAAGYSGRMPSATLADAIVDTARSVLERSISFITEKYGCHGFRVVYGDTDSIFVAMRGLSTVEAIEAGKKLAEEITSLFKRPISLMFEKVYHPSFLLTKKKYVGRKFSPSSLGVGRSGPLPHELEAKGIEIIRSDALPFTARIMKESLQVLFDTLSLDALIAFLTHELVKVLKGDAKFEEFILRRTNHASSPNSIVAHLCRTFGAEFAAKDHVAFVVTNGPSRLLDRAMLLEDYFADRSKVLDITYYLMKQIVPPLHRLFYSLYTPDFSIPSLVFELIRKYGHAKNSFRLGSMALLAGGIERNIEAVQALCIHCSNGRPNEISECISTDCSVLYKRLALMEAFDFIR